MKSTRLQWPDKAKAIGMLLVFWGHFIEPYVFQDPHPLLHDTYKLIYAFHMPFFFILAGYFYRPSAARFGEFLLLKFRTRIVPMLFFCALAMPLWLHPEWLGRTDINPQEQAGKWTFLLQGRPVYNWASWFLSCLFMVELVASELLPMLRSEWGKWVAILAVYTIGILLTGNPAKGAQMLGTSENWWFIQEAWIALAFYLLGHQMANTGRRLMPGYTPMALKALIPAISVAALLLTFNLNLPGGGTINMSGSTHGHWFFFAFTAMAGSLALCHLAYWLPENRLLTFIGQQTLPLIGIAGIFLEFLNNLVRPIYGETHSDITLLIVTFISSSATLVVSLPVVWLLDRYLPWLIGKWK